jgi:hypothetical protein
MMPLRLGCAGNTKKSVVPVEIKFLSVPKGRLHQNFHTEGC